MTRQVERSRNFDAPDIASPFQRWAVSFEEMCGCVRSILADSVGDRSISLLVDWVMRLDDDGRVAHWSDYWDAREFLTLPTAGIGR